MHNDILLVKSIFDENQAFLNWFMAIIGKTIKAKPAIPSTRQMFAPGQCITLKSEPIKVMLAKDVPRIIAVFFIGNCFKVH